MLPPWSGTWCGCTDRCRRRIGGGTRRCIGAAFAAYEMKVVLARILSRVTLQPAPRYRARLVRRSIAFTPSEGLPVVVSERLATS